MHKHEPTGEKHTVPDVSTMKLREEIEALKENIRFLERELGIGICEHCKEKAILTTGLCDVCFDEFMSEAIR